MTDGLHEFKPDWCLAPDGLLREWMEENDVSLRSLAAACADDAGVGGAEALIQEVLDREPLRLVHADLLAAGTGISARFWMTYESHYRAGLAAGLKDVSEPLEGSPS